MAALWQGLAQRRLGWPTRRWIPGSTAPSWVRRIWRERFREVPKGPVLDMDRIRRIAYL